MKRNWIIIALMLIALPTIAQNRQPQVIDKVVAVVGKNIILQSDIENQYIQYRMQGMAEGTGQEVRTRILEDLLLQKLMLNQAEMDSITVTDEEVERQMDQKLQYFISRFGSKEKMEAQFGKTLTEIKDELRKGQKDQMLQEQVQNKIMESVAVTPQEVKDFFAQYPEADRYLGNIFALVDQSVDSYQERGYTRLMLNFGCTGGRHRSVYCAEQTAAHLREKYAGTLVVNIFHLEQAKF
jgi:parvulin-like peptidyl-prolyl isomerase